MVSSLVEQKQILATLIHQRFYELMETTPLHSSEFKDVPVLEPHQLTDGLDFQEEHHSVYFVFLVHTL